MRFATILMALSMLAAVPGRAPAARLKDLVEVEGVRPNALVGMGVVVGLAGTGDDIMSSAFARRELAAMSRHLGVSIDPKEVMSKNVAAVTVTAKLPPFARRGMPLDVTVSSMGGAKSLQGGTLVATPLKGADGQTYALAQGALLIGGFSAGGQSGTQSSKNHTTVGRVPGGAVVERAAPGQLPDGQLTLALREPDFTTAARIAAAVNQNLGGPAARVRDPGAVTVAINKTWQGRVVELVATLEAIEANPDMPARVVIDERTGTVVVGAAVTLLPAAIAYGGITVNVTEQAAVVQPGALSKGQTQVVPQTQVDVQEKEGQLRVLPQTASVGDLASALNALGVKPRDLVAIFQALKAAGALRAQLEVL